MMGRWEGVNAMTTKTRFRSFLRALGAGAALLAGGAGLIALAGSELGCSNASRTLKYSSPSPDPGVIYVAEQVYGLDDWARTPDARSYARVTTRDGEANEGPLVRISSQSVVMSSKDKGGPDITIDKEAILFMRVWW
jgi:hypothetical protein